MTLLPNEHNAGFATSSARTRAWQHLYVRT